MYRGKWAGWKDSGAPERIGYMVGFAGTGAVIVLAVCCVIGAVLWLVGVR
jgi:hypothetical protein